MNNVKSLAEELNFAVSQEKGFQFQEEAVWNDIELVGLSPHTMSENEQSSKEVMEGEEEENPKPAVDETKESDTNVVNKGSGDENSSLQEPAVKDEIKEEEVCIILIFFWYMLKDIK